MRPPTAEGGRLRAQDLRTARRPARPQRLADPHRPGHRRRRPGQPAASRAPTRTSAASSPTACATPSGSRSGRARTTSGSPTAATATGRRSTACRTRPTRCATSAGRATRARWTRTATRTRASGPRSDDHEPRHLREPVRGGHRDAAPYWAYDHELPRRAGRGLPRERAGRADQHLSQRRRVLPEGRGSFPAAYRRRPVLRRPLARLHLGDAARPRRPAASRAAW